MKEVDMSKKEQVGHFDETHHALLFAWIAQAIEEQVGQQKGEDVIRKTVRQYGEERGRRMLLRAQAKKHALSMINYLGYREYNISPGVMDLKISSKPPHAMFSTSTCPWHKAWEENGLMSVGKLYCLEIDQALLRGFNPNLQLEVIGTLPAGDPRCEFIYHDANLKIPNIVLFGYRKVINPGPKAVMPWDYHVGHLFNTFEKVANKELGKVGQQAVEVGLARFGERYGESALKKVMASRNMDFDIIPQ
jgi:hypothetical protein